MKSTNFDRHLSKQLEDSEFATKYAEAGASWDIALKLTQLRQDAGLSQSELARMLNTSQQQISRLESPSYEGHSISMLRRVAEALNARIVVAFEPLNDKLELNEPNSKYNKNKKRS